jgi:CRISPR-associated protein Cas5d
MKGFRTQTKGTKPLNYNAPGNALAIYTFLTGDPDPGSKLPCVEYQVRAHFEWNRHRPELEKDRIAGKHFQVAQRSLERGGRQDIFLGTRDCQGYVAPCVFGSGVSDFDRKGELGFGLMFHSFDYPDETGEEKLQSSFWFPKMLDGIITFPRPENCTLKKFVGPMAAKQFGAGRDMRSVEAEEAQLEL